MKRYVVDASVAVKWYLPEIQTADAMRLLRADHELVAPDLILAETANVFLKNVRRAHMDADDVREPLDSLMGSVELVSGASLIHDATQLAVAHNRSAYDALYVALALRERCQFVTADRRLYNALAEPFPGNMLWVEDYRDEE